MPDVKEREAIRAAIRTVLMDFVERPFFDVRERDVQARLHHEIRARLSPPDVELLLRSQNARRVHEHPVLLRTSRVHLEAKNGKSGKVPDLVVLTAKGPVELVVWDNGPLDVIAPVRQQDLAAVIEVKAAPSKSEWKGFRDDLRKLNDMIGMSSDCVGFFVAFDKSLPLGGTRSTIRPRHEWLDVLVEDPSGVIEAHYADVSGRVQSRIGRVGEQL